MNRACQTVSSGYLLMFANDGVDRPIYRTLKKGRLNRNIKSEIRFHIEPGQVFKHVALSFKEEDQLKEEGQHRV